ncbi:MAG: cobyrinate a,c-diamide synthase [Desulfosalsimonadaceae bacterium]|nr:cobyrinate a,c-diamide synthase [Desulfosalsimonadaceae bacterium]
MMGPESANGIVIAGTGSGVGKTSVALGVARALARRGIRVQPFKVGPDFLDPTYLGRAAGRICYNLDTWMSGDEYVKSLYAKHTQGNVTGIVEGAMGMFDGQTPTSSDGSTAHVAGILGLPVILVVNAHGAARSLCATVKGFSTFDDRVTLGGVVANQVGSEKHARMLAEAFQSSGLPPLVGSILRGGLPELKHRHLGLIHAGEQGDAEALLDELGECMEKSLDMTAIAAMAGSGAGIRNSRPRNFPHPNAGPVVRMAIARDSAFCFTYPDNLECLENAGVAWVPFSPCRDGALPEGIDALYLPGGYPELHARTLSANTGMISSIRGFAASGRLIYAECGGLMYLSQGLVDHDGHTYPMAGILPVETRMNPRLRRLGYASVTLARTCCWGNSGDRLRGHEFHYSEIADDDIDPDHLPEGWEPGYRLENRSGVVSEGFLRANVLASYVHLHWASSPQAAGSFVRHALVASRKAEQTRK